MMIQSTYFKLLSKASIFFPVLLHTFLKSKTLRTSRYLLIVSLFCSLKSNYVLIYVETIAGWPGTCYINQVDLKLTDLLSKSSGVKRTFSVWLTPLGFCLLLVLFFGI